MPEKIKLTGEPSPGPIPTIEPVPGATPGSAPKAPIVGSGTVSVEEAIAASDHTKISTITGFGASGVPGQQPGQSVSVGGLVDGKLATELMDAVLPSIMVFLLYKVGMKLRKPDLQLTEKEKNTIAPIMSKCLESLMINFNNPWAALSVAMITIYGAKVAEKAGVAYLDKKTADQQKDILDARIKTSEPKASVVDMTSIPRADMGSVPYEPTETEIKDKMTREKMGRKKAIERLKVVHANKHKK